MAQLAVLKGKAERIATGAEIFPKRAALHGLLPCVVVAFQATVYLASAGFLYFDVELLSRFAVPTIDYPNSDRIRIYCIRRRPGNSRALP